MDSYTSLMLLLSVGDRQEVNELIQDPTTRTEDGGAGRGHVAVGFIEVGFCMKAIKT